VCFPYFHTWWKVAISMEAVQKRDYPTWLEFEIANLTLWSCSASNPINKVFHGFANGLTAQKLSIRQNPKKINIVRSKQQIPFFPVSFNFNFLISHDLICDIKIDTCSMFIRNPIPSSGSSIWSSMWKQKLLKVGSSNEFH